MHVAGAVRILVAQTQIFDHQRLAVLDVYLVCLAQSKAVEEHMAAHTHDVAVFLTVAAELLHHLGVQTPGNYHLVAGLGQEFFHLFAGGFKVHGGQQLAGAAGYGLFALEHDLLQLLGEAPGGLAHHALEVGHHGIGIAQLRALFKDILRRQVVLHHEYGHVAHHFGGGSYLHDAAHHVVDLLIHLLDFLEAAAKADGLHLGIEVCVLSAGYLVLIDVGDGALDAVVELFVSKAHIGPVIGEILQPVKVKACIPLLPVQRRHNGVHGGLACKRGHGGNGQIHHVHAGFRRHKNGGHLVCGGVVGVQMHGDAYLLLELADKLFGGIGLQKARHVLYGQHVSAALFQLLGHIYIVLKREFVICGVQNIAGVADGGLTQLALL